MRTIDQQERLIVRELIKNPRISDNQISKNTGVPLKTVNTKRKRLEKDNIIRYYTEIDNSLEGTGLFLSRHLYKIVIREGITRKQVVDSIPDMHKNHLFRKHILFSFIGEENGKVVLFLMIESYKGSDIIEIFNAEVVPFIKSHLGDVIISTEVSNIRYFVRLFHNYIPYVKDMDDVFVYG